MKRGIVLEVDDEFVTLLTPEGEFIQVKKERGYEIGEEIETMGRERPIFRHHPFRYIITSLAAACLLIFTILFHYSSDEVYAYMSIDINPSIELAVNKDLEVMKIKGYNDEGKEIISHLSHWKEKKFVDIAEEIIELSMKNGYLQKGGHVFITTVEKEHRRSSSRELSKELHKIQQSYQPKNIVVKTTTSTIAVRNEAAKQGITTGKFLQITKKETDTHKPYEKKETSPFKTIERTVPEQRTTQQANEQKKETHPLQQQETLKKEDKEKEKKKMMEEQYGKKQRVVPLMQQKRIEKEKQETLKKEDKEKEKKQPTEEQHGKKQRVTPLMQQKWMEKEKQKTLKKEGKEKEKKQLEQYRKKQRVTPLMQQKRTEKEKQKTLKKEDREKEKQKENHH